MEEKRNFKNIKEPNTNNISLMGNALPVVKSLIDIGLTEANANGEANIKKTIKNPKGAGKKPKSRDESFYPNHKIIEIENKVLLVLKPNSTLNVGSFKEFIEATESEKAIDIVDILPPLYDAHYKLIADVNKRIMKGDKVIVNFKYRSTIESVSLEQKKPIEVKEVKFKNLKDMTVVIAYLTNKDFYPINELDLYDTD